MRVPVRFLAIAVVLATWCTALHAEPPRRDPVRLVAESERIVLGRVAAVHTIENPHEGYWLQEVALAEVEILETWKGRTTGECLFFLASPTWTCDVSQAEVGETAVLFLHPYVARRNLGEDEHALETKAFAEASASLLDGGVLYELALSGGGRMPVVPVAGVQCAKISLASARDLLPYLWSVQGPDPRYPISRYVELAALRELVGELTILPEGEDYGTLFHAESEARCAAFERLVARPGTDAFAVMAVARCAAPYDDELGMRIEGRVEEAADRVGPLLLRLADDPVPVVRLGAAGLLAWCGDSVALEPLLEGAAPPARRLVASALIERGRVSWEVDGDAAVLARLLVDEDARVRERALTAALLLAEGFEGDGLAPFLRASTDADPRVRRLASRGLGDPAWCFSGPEAAARALAALSRGLHDEDLSARRAASEGVLELVRAIREFESDTAAELAPFEPCLAAALEPVRAAARDPDPRVRGTGLAALCETARPEDVEVLRQAIADESPWLRRCAARGLGGVPTDAAVEALASAVKDEDWRTGVIAVEALVRIKTPAAGARLVDTLRSARGMVRWAAAEGLGKVGDASADTALLEALLEGEPEVQWRAAIALRERGIASVPSLVRAAREGDPYAADRAVYALSCFLRSDDEDDRVAAVYALWQAGARDADTIRTLEHHRDDPSPAVREAVAEVLEQLGADDR